MPLRNTCSAALCAALPLLALAATPREQPTKQPPAKADEAPQAAKLEPKKNFVEKTKGFKTVVDDPDADPPKTHKEDMTASFEMVWVPGGEFTMGSTDKEPGRDAIEGPTHRVKVGSFWMAWNISERSATSAGSGPGAGLPRRRMISPACRMRW